jgi:hypothetical protein
MTYRDVSQLTGIPVEKLLTMEQPERDRLSQIIARRAGQHMCALAPYCRVQFVYFVG